MIVGVDGCEGGWLAVAQPGSRSTPTATIHETFLSLLEAHAEARCIAIDIPIGLPERGTRMADVEARRAIKPRSSSVFPAPIRGVLRARTYDEANRRHREISGKGMTKQTYAILPKIAEVDAALRGDTTLRDRVVEVHPELSFRSWKGAPLEHPKRSGPGKADRAGLIESAWPGAIAVCTDRLGRGSGWALDDLHDAFAALWTAQRIVAGTALTVPEVSQVDSVGLPMRIQA